MLNTFSNLFHPQKSNKQRSKVLHPESLLYFCLIAVFAFALIRIFSLFPNPTINLKNFNTLVSVDKVIELTNFERQKYGLTKLSQNSKLTKAAEEKAEHMIKKQYWAHVAPDGTAPWDFIKETNYQYVVAGENLARDFSNSQDMVKAWMNSTTHRDNIINPKYDEIGIAVIEGEFLGKNTKLIVQIFGSTQAKPISSKIFSPADNKIDNSNPKILGEEFMELASLEDHPLFSSSQLLKAVFLALVLIICFTLIYDQLVAGNTKRESRVGNNFGHLLLFATVAFLLAFFRSGVIK
jgi:hypothetical protein